MTQQQQVKYTREDLKLVGGDLFAVLGFVKDTPGYENRPVHIARSDSDDAVYAKVRDAVADAVRSSFAGRGFDGLPDKLLAFCFAEGLLKQEAAVEEEEEIAGAVSDEDDLLGMTDDLAAAGIDDNLSAVLGAVSAAGDPSAARRATPSASADEKLDRLAAEHGEPVFAGARADEMSLSPVTVANAEATVLTIANLLAQGKFVIIGALDVTALTAQGILAPRQGVEAPTGLKPVSAEKIPVQAVRAASATTSAAAKSDPITVSDAIQKRLLSIKDENALEAWIGVLFRTKLTADAQRKAFIKRHGVPTSKPVEKLPGRTMATEIKVYLRETWAALKK